MKQIIDELSRRATDEGRIIELGWLALRKAAIPADASEVQLAEMRKAFFAGAQHLFASILSILEPGEDATEADLGRMDKIDAELREFVRRFKEDNFS